MNSPTDRERPALSEGDRALIKAGSAARSTSAYYEQRGDLRAAKEWSAHADAIQAAARAEASPKPALTQGGVVELVNRLRVPFQEIRGGVRATKLQRVLDERKEAATALERLAGERGGEAVRSHHRHDWMQPGDTPHRVFVLRFEDADMREMIWTDEDAEADALAAWAKYAPAWNITLLATLAVPGRAPQPLPGEVERIAREAFDAALRYALGDRFQTNDRLTLEQREQVFQAILTAHPALGGGGR